MRPTCGEKCGLAGKVTERYGCAPSVSRGPDLKGPGAAPDAAGPVTGAPAPSRVTAKIHSGIITTDRPNRMWVIAATARSPSSPPLTIAQPSVWAFMPSSHPLRGSRTPPPRCPTSCFRGGAAEGLRPGTITRHERWNELTFLGIESSPAFGQRVSNASGRSRSNCYGSGPFNDTGTGSGPEFRALYNQHWLIERLGPASGSGSPCTATGRLSSGAVRLTGQHGFVDRGDLMGQRLDDRGVPRARVEEMRRRIRCASETRRNSAPSVAAPGGRPRISIRGSS